MGVHEKERIVKKIFMLIICCFFLSGCAGGTGPNIDWDKACIKAKAVVEAASAEVQKYKDAGIVSGDDYQKAILAESAAKSAMLIVCP